MQQPGGGPTHMQNNSGYVVTAPPAPQPGGGAAAPGTQAADGNASRGWEQRVIDKVMATGQGLRAYDETVRSGDIDKLKRHLHRFNMLVGTLLVVVAGVLQAIMQVLSLSVSGTVVSLYCAAFGVGVLMYEKTTSVKVQNYLRVNYGFVMTHNGRTVFLLLVGLFACGAGGLGTFAGCFAVIDAIFHVYVVKRAPGMKEFVHHDSEARLEGGHYDSEAQASADFMTRMANTAFEDPSAARQMLSSRYSDARKVGDFAQQNPQLVQTAMSMGGATAGGAGGAGAGVNTGGAPQPEAPHGLNGGALPDPRREMADVSLDDDFDPRSGAGEVVEKRGLLG
jgi:hypothetical protein